MAILLDLNLIRVALSTGDILRTRYAPQYRNVDGVDLGQTVRQPDPSKRGPAARVEEAGPESRTKREPPSSLARHPGTSRAWTAGFVHAKCKPSVFLCG